MAVGSCRACGCAVAYVAWIPAVADDSHPALAFIAAAVFWGALLAFLGLVAVTIRRKAKKPLQK